MKTYGKKLINYFLRGLVVILPISLTIYVLFWIISLVEEFLNLDRIFGKHNPFSDFNFPGLGVIIAFSLIFLSGIIVTHFVGAPVRNWLINIFNRLPIFRFLYSSIKDITEALVGEERKFTEPVVVNINDVGLKRIGFITKKDLKIINEINHVAVYFPMSYSFAGNVYIVPNERLKPLNIKAADAMKFVVSGGVIDLE